MTKNIPIPISGLHSEGNNPEIVGRMASLTVSLLVRPVVHQSGKGSGYGLLRVRGMVN